MSSDAEGSSTDLVLVTAAVAAVGAVAAALPLRNWDYWYDLTVGRLLAARHAVPGTNLFGYTGDLSEPVFINAWIGDFWLFRLYEMGGLGATLVARNLCAIAALAIIARCTYRLSQRHAGVTAATVLAAGLTFLALGGFAGPQMFAWPLFALLAFVCVELLYRERHLWIAPVAFAVGGAFWANLAPNFWVPVLLAAAFFGTARWQAKRRHERWFAAAALTCVATWFATPLGTAIVGGFTDWTGMEAWVLLGGPMALGPILAPIVGVWQRPLRRAAAVVIAGILCTAALALQPWSAAHQSIPAALFGEGVRQNDPLRGQAPASIPVEAVEVLRSWGSQPRIYSEPHLCGYLLFEIQDPMSPRRIVWPVPGVSPTDEVARLALTLETQPEVFRGAFQQYDVEAVIITPGLVQLGEYLAAAPDWDLVGEWPSGALYRHMPGDRPVGSVQK